jgi:hypothetical protein
MADSTTILDTITSSQSQKETTANAMFDAMSPAALFGRRALTTTGLTWGYYGGWMMVDGVLTQIANGTILLNGDVGSPSLNVNYVEATRAGVVSSNTTGFTAGSIPLYKVTCSATAVSSYEDYRNTRRPHGLLNKVLTDADTTLTAAEAANEILQFTGSLSVGRNVILPTAVRQYTVYNNTGSTGSPTFPGFDLTFKTASGTGVAVAYGKRAIIYADGTNVVRVTADT